MFKFGNKREDYKEIADKIVKGLGGRENIITIDNCVSRLRLELHETAKINKDELKDAGAVEVIVQDKNSVQIIIGPKVQFIAEEMKKKECACSSKIEAESTSKKDFSEIASEVIKGLGGKENIITIDNCITRLRMELRDSNLVDKVVLKQAGAVDTVVVDEHSVQVIIGSDVQEVADEMRKQI